MEQMTLFERQSKLYQKLLEYHKNNPHIYPMFKKYTIQAIQSGYRRFGSQMIIEKIRWETGVVAKDDKFKISNDAAAFYSRLFMLEYPHYKDYFRIRPSEADLLKLEDLNN